MRAKPPPGLELEFVRFGAVTADTDVEIFASIKVPELEQTTGAGVVEGTVVTLFIPVGGLYKGSDPSALGVAGLAAFMLDKYGAIIRYADRLQRARTGDVGALAANTASDYITLDVDMARGIIRSILVEAQSVAQNAPTVRVLVFGDDVAAGSGSSAMRFIGYVDILLLALKINSSSQDTFGGEYLWQAQVDTEIPFANLEPTETTNLYLIVEVVGGNDIAEGYVTLYIEPRASWEGASY